MNPNPSPVSSTVHSFITGDARRLSAVATSSIDLVVTSPPYPMIAMWDDLFRAAHASIGRALDEGDGPAAFTLMHAELEKTWDELFRIIRPGGFFCLNIGDATRTIGGVFRLYPNHSIIEQFFRERGADILPRIIWRKATNAPNKFMGSGMFPAGAYVTLEHEYILIMRAPGKRRFPPAERERRRQSAVFWEERNAWYSDLWELGGVRQAFNGMPAARPRSGAFPFALPWRLISMYSLHGDTVLDPFAGTGTVAAAAAAVGRNSISVDIDADLIAAAERRLAACAPEAARAGRTRLADHLKFVAEHQEKGETFAYRNMAYGFPVKTSQERDLIVPIASAVRREGEGRYRVEYDGRPAQEAAVGWLF